MLKKSCLAAFIIISGIGEGSYADISGNGEGSLPTLYQSGSQYSNGSIYHNHTPTCLDWMGKMFGSGESPRKRSFKKSISDADAKIEELRQKNNGPISLWDQKSSEWEKDKQYITNQIMNHPSYIRPYGPKRTTDNRVDSLIQKIEIILRTIVPDLNKPQEPGTCLGGLLGGLTVHAKKFQQFPYSLQNDIKIDKKAKFLKFVYEPNPCEEEYQPSKAETSEYHMRGSVRSLMGRHPSHNKKVEMTNIVKLLGSVADDLHQKYYDLHKKSKYGKNQKEMGGDTFRQQKKESILSFCNAFRQAWLNFSGREKWLQQTNNILRDLELVKKAFQEIERADKKLELTKILDELRSHDKDVLLPRLSQVVRDRYLTLERVEEVFNDDIRQQLEHYMENHNIRTDRNSDASTVLSGKEGGGLGLRISQSRNSRNIKKRSTNKIYPENSGRPQNSISTKSSRFESNISEETYKSNETNETNETVSGHS